MIRITLIGFVLLSFTLSGNAQDAKEKEAVLTLHNALPGAEADSSKVNALIRLTRYHGFNNNYDSVVYYGIQALQQSRALGMTELEIHTLNSLGLAYAFLGDYAMKRSLALKSLKLSRLHGIEREEAIALLQLGISNIALGENALAKKRYQEALPIFKKLQLAGFEIITKSELGMAYYELGMVDSAFACQYDALKGREIPHSRPIQKLGVLHYNMGALDSSMYYFNKLKQLDKDEGLYADLWRGRIFHKRNQLDSAQRTARKVLASGLEKNDWRNIIRSAVLLSDIYESNDPAEALVHSKMALAYTDSLNTMRILNANENITDYNEQVQQYEIDLATSEYQSQVRQYALLAGMVVLLLIGSIIYYFYRQKHKTNIQLVNQKDALNAAIRDLKSTQSQLIHSEKMASLGELTAGIAHEIQNPLNFVNNFSEVSNELIEEMNDAMEKGDLPEARAIAGDLKQNLEKINHHGKRADGIVKGMLQHSRSGDGKKEPTDLNTLVDEYLRLAYHGMRARNKAFNTSLETDFGESVGEATLVPQDIGRVVLNLLTNAFHAVEEKKERAPEGFEPRVRVQTRKAGKTIEIRVADNGKGMPESVKAKIFQPFFTTKPTGQGTGLGLSLSYDIVKAHGGEIVVASEEGEGTEFTIKLPAQ